MTRKPHSPPIGCGSCPTCSCLLYTSDPLPEDAPQFVKDYYAYYKTPRDYHPRSLNSNGGWNVTSSLSFLNMPILQYSSEIRSAVLLVHGEKAHSRYFSETAYSKMCIRDSATASHWRRICTRRRAQRASCPPLPSAVRSVR